MNSLIKLFITIESTDFETDEINKKPLGLINSIHFYRNRNYPSFIRSSISEQHTRSNNTGLDLLSSSFLNTSWLTYSSVALLNLTLDFSSFLSDASIKFYSQSLIHYGVGSIASTWKPILANPSDMSPAPQLTSKASLLSKV
jgi:hypothetical protein